MDLFLRGASLVIALMSLAVLLFATAPSPASASDKDCSNFNTQRAAQIFFLKHGGPRYDPDRLDGDHDGIACEDNSCPCYYKQHLPRRAEMAVAADWRIRGASV